LLLLKLEREYRARNRSSAILAGLDQSPDATQRSGSGPVLGYLRFALASRDSLVSSSQQSILEGRRNRGAFSFVRLHLAALRVRSLTVGTDN